MSVIGSSDLIGRAPGGRKLVAVVFADMVDYSRLLGLDDIGTLGRLQTLRRTLIDPAISEHGGRIVSTAGDSLFIEFDSIDGAVRCAVAIQKQVPDYDGEQPPDRAIRFRLGINIGDVIADGTNLHGDGVNVAARLQATCPPGAICVSRAVRDHVRDRLDLNFDALGPLVLKNIRRPIEAFVLQGSGKPSSANRAMVSTPNPGLSKAPRLSMVILPFTTLDTEPFTVSLADAITDDLTHELASIAGHIVIARTSAATYKARPIDVRRIGEELGVRYVIEGSVRKADDKLRVNVQLISASTNTRLWGDRFEEDVRDLAPGLDRIIRRLRDVLDVQVLDAEIAQGESERPGDPDAYDLVLRAWSGWSKPPSSDHLQRMTALLEWALRLDPTMVPALYSLAQWLTYRYTGLFGSADWGNEDLADRAATALSTAADIEPNNEWVLPGQGFLLRAQGRWAEARLICNRLLALFPNSALGHLLLARIEAHAGQPEKAIQAAKMSIRLAPLLGTVWSAKALIGNCLLLLERDEEAIEWVQRALAETPRNEHRMRAYRHLYLASGYALTNDLPSAHREIKDASRLWPYATARSIMPGAEPRGLPSPAYAAAFRRVRDGLRVAGLRDHADEHGDFDVPPNLVTCTDLEGRTPVTAPGVITVRTSELVELIAHRNPLLIDLALGSWGQSIPGAVGLQGLGSGADFSVSVQSRFISVMRDLTHGDMAIPIVAFCANCERITGYNLALRLVSLGYTQIYWYRGGFESWQIAGLPEADLELQNW
jgi:adenylate cyclase